MKLEFNWPSVFRGEVSEDKMFENVDGRMTDGTASNLGLLLQKEQSVK